MRAIAMVVSSAFAMFAIGAYAQAPANATAQCKDGSYTTTTTHRGACKGHGGVKDWLDNAPAGAATTHADTGKTTRGDTAKTTHADSGKTSAPESAPSRARNQPSATGVAPGPQTATAAPGGGAGKVWVNTSTKVYHCSGDQWYGKTKHGEYLSEDEAKAKGYHASHGKACE